MHRFVGDTPYAIDTLLQSNTVCPCTAVSTRIRSPPPTPTRTLYPQSQTDRSDDAFPDQQPRDLLHPSASEEAKQHKLKRLVQSPNSYFMDVKCPGCFNMYDVSPPRIDYSESDSVAHAFS